MRTPALITLAGWLWIATPAQAAPPQVEEARKLIDDLELDAALKALDAADKTEGNDRATVMEILTLQGIAFGTLNKEAKTRDSFRKLLMLDPEATLPADLPPRVRTPFFEAKEWVSTNGPLTVVPGAEVSGGEVISVKLTVQKDVLRLARIARFHLEVEGSRRKLDVPFSGGKAEAPVGKPGVSWRAEVLSERKGVLLTFGSKDAPLREGVISEVASSSESAEIDATVAPAGGWRRPTGVVLLGAGAVTAGIGVVLGVQSAAARNQLTTATRDSEGRVTGLTQAQAGPLEAGANTQAAVANVLFGVGGALGAAGVVLVILGPSSEPSVALSPTAGGVLLTGNF